MPRRSFLIWFGRTVYTVCAAIVALPVGWFLGSATRRTEEDSLRQRVARLEELQVGQPRLMSVIGTKQNAWTRSPNQVIGRVWIVRETPPDVVPERTKLKVFNAICPHGGCPIAAVVSDGYLCPCHGAKFQADGSKVADGPDYVNASPRGMDPLPYEVVKDEATGAWWVVVDYQEFEVGIAERIEKA